MYDPQTSQRILAAIMDLQDTWAHSLSWDGWDHEVLVQVSVTNQAGQVLETLVPPNGATHTNSVASPSYQQRAFNGMDDTCRLHALATLGKMCFYLAADPGAVISATIQDKRNSFGQRALDHVVVVSLQGSTVVAEHREYQV